MDLLSQQDLAKAVRLNLVWREKLGGLWPSDDAFRAAGIAPSGVETPELALAVASYQDAQKLHVDGIVGPKTAFRIRDGRPWVAPEVSGSFLIRGARVPVDGVRVLDFETTGLSFGAGRGTVLRRTQTVRMGVLHTTGGEGSGHQVWNTLVDRNLSVDCLIDFDGTVYQYSDPGTVATMHAGWANAISWGFEMTNDLRPTRGKRKRPLVRGTLLGKPFRWDGLLPAQLDAAVRSIGAFCDAFGIPRRIPGREGKPLDGPAVPLSLLVAYRKAKRARKTALARTHVEEATAILRDLYDGCIVGHFMTSLSGKPDPSPDVFQALLEGGFEIREVP